MREDWRGKVAVITGGTTGIGLALAKALADEGMNLVISSRNPSNLQATVEALSNCGGGKY